MTATASVDLLGVGVGPANLSLAALLYPRQEIRSLFLDLKSSFGWHDGQQLPDTSLQVSIFKDLVTMADPTNEFSFLNYLRDEGRLYHFVNAQFDAVPRLEFRNYLEWVSRRLKTVVFGEEVRSIDFDDTDEVFVVQTDERVLTANNVAIGVGGRPWTPPVRDCLQSHTQFHVCDFVGKAQHLGGQRVVVVGGGQSGAEAFLDLISREGAELPSRVSWISRRRNFLPIDDTPFTNDYYMPSYSEYFYRLDPAARRRINRENLLTSDGISESTLRAIYQRIYRHRFITGAQGLIKLYPNRAVIKACAADGRWDLMLVDNDAPSQPVRMAADVIVWATGFRSGPTDLLRSLDHRLDHDVDEYRVDQDFAIDWDGPPDRRIFLQNAALGQRGLADKNLSLLAWRSQRIADRLCGVHREEPLVSFVQWGDDIESCEPRREASGWAPTPSR